MLTSWSIYREFFAEIVTCDVTPTSVLAFVSALRSPPNFLLLACPDARRQFNPGTGSSLPPLVSWGGRLICDSFV